MKEEVILSMADYQRRLYEWKWWAQQWL